MKLTELKTTVYDRLQVTTTKEVKAFYPEANLATKAGWEAILEELTADLSLISTEIKEASQDDPGLGSMELNEDIENFPTDWAGIALTIEKYDAYVAQAADSTPKPELCDEFVPIDIAEAILSTVSELDSTVVTLGMLCVDPEWVEDETPTPTAPLFAPVPVALWDFLPGANLVEIFTVEFPSDWVHWIQAICTSLGVHSCDAAMMQGLKQARRVGLEV